MLSDMRHYWLKRCSFTASTPPRFRPMVSLAEQAMALKCDVEWALQVKVENAVWQPKIVHHIGQDWYVELVPTSAQVCSIVAAIAGEAPPKAAKKPSLTHVDGFKRLVALRNAQQSLEVQAPEPKNACSKMLNSRRQRLQSGLPLKYPRCGLNQTSSTWCCLGVTVTRL